jgi:hypothetical protein
MHIPQKLTPWFDARKKYRLTHAEVQMARELGLNPAKLGGIANSSQELWKVPLSQFLEQLYLKSFGISRPVRVISLEELISQRQAKKKEKRKLNDQKDDFQRIKERS